MYNTRSLMYGTSRMWFKDFERLAQKFDWAEPEHGAKLVAMAQMWAKVIQMREQRCSREDICRVILDGFLEHYPGVVSAEDLELMVKLGKMMREIDRQDLRTSPMAQKTIFHNSFTKKHMGIYVRARTVHGGGSDGFVAGYAAQSEENAKLWELFLEAQEGSTRRGQIFKMAFYVNRAMIAMVKASSRREPLEVPPEEADEVGLQEYEAFIKSRFVRHYQRFTDFAFFWNLIQLGQCLIFKRSFAWLDQPLKNKRGDSFVLSDPCYTWILRPELDGHFVENLAGGVRQQLIYYRVPVRKVE